MILCHFWCTLILFICIGLTYSCLLPSLACQKKNFWNLLNSITMAYPRSMLGYRLLSQSFTNMKKIGYRPFASSSNTSGLQLFMDQNGLTNLEYSWPKFTWSNKRHGLDNILERLDRGFANSHGPFYFIMPRFFTCLYIPQITHLSSWIHLELVMLWSFLNIKNSGLEIQLIYLWLKKLGIEMQMVL